MNFLHFFNIFFVVKSFDVGKIMASVFFPKCYMKVVLGIHAVEKKVYAARDGDWFLCTYILERIAGALQLHWSCIHHEQSFLLLLLGRCDVLVYTYYVPLSLTGACAFFYLKKKLALKNLRL